MYVGIDIGGTNVRAALSKSVEKPKILKKIVFKNNHLFDEIINKLSKFIESNTDFVDGISISAAGDLNKDKSEIVDASFNTPELLNKPIVETLKKKFGCKVVMENDAVTSSLGEAFFRKEDEDFVYLIWGSGIGGAEVKYDEKIDVRQIDWYKYLREWEDDCGGKSIEKMYTKDPKELNEIEWISVLGKFKSHLEEFIRDFDKQIKLVVFGGGVAVSQFGRIKDILDTKSISLEVTRLGNDAGLYGAFVRLKNNI